MRRTLQLLATMTPQRHPAGEPYPRRRAPPPEAVAEAIAGAFAATSLPPEGETLRLAIDVADGRNLVVAIGPDRLDMFGETGESTGDDDDDDADQPLERCIEALVPLLVDVTGWEAESELLIYDFEGACPGCGRGFYDWESACRDCGHRVDGSIEPELCRRRAQELLRRMVAAGLVEWEEGAVGSEPGELVERLASHIERQAGEVNPAQVLRILEGSPRVAELYGDDDDVRAAWALVGR
ncbi:MAG: hypothetical protein H6710_18385 [Myxococcales bacterium]|nr:hypothetical protein [Myxococcales bacterium]